MCIFSIWKSENKNKNREEKRSAENGEPNRIKIDYLLEINLGPFLPYKTNWFDRS